MITAAILFYAVAWLASCWAFFHAAVHHTISTQDNNREKPKGAAAKEK